MSGKSKRGGVPNRPQATITHQQSISVSAPIPPPEMIQKYNEIHPELGTEIIRNFNSETHHRRGLETEQMAQSRALVDSNVKKQNLASISKLLATITAAFIIIGWMSFSMWLVISGRPMEGWISLAVQLVAMITIFLNTSKSAS